MGVLEDFASWFTGRSGLYEDTDKVQSAIDNLEKIKTSTVEDGKETVQAAIDKLNSVKGFYQYVGSLNRSAFDPLFDVASETIDGLVGQINAKVADIEEYNNSSLGEKILATGGMVVTKFGEGLLSVGEDIFDAGVTVVAGWTTKAYDYFRGTNYNEAVSDFIETDYSHKAFEWYYDSDLAKASAITEDSGAAMLAEGAGAATGYLALGSFSVGALTGKSGKVAKAAQTFLGNTTRANTTIAAVGGYGGGVEQGLQSGQSFGEANLTGLKQGVAQGTLAYGTAKLGQYTQKQVNIKKAQDTFSKASNSVDDAKAALDKAQKNVTSAQNRVQT